MARILRGDFRKSGHVEQGVGQQQAPPDYRLTLSLGFSDPPIWRRIVLSGGLTLADLHHVIQASFGWNDGADHRFLVGKIFYRPASGQPGGPDTALVDGCRDEAAVTLAQLEEGMSFLFTYLYDGGQGWEVEITLEEAISPPSCSCPQVVDGERGCPPEAVGDIHAYQALVHAWETNPAPRTHLPPVIPQFPDFSVECWDRAGINRYLEQRFCSSP